MEACKIELGKLSIEDTPGFQMIESLDKITSIILTYPDLKIVAKKVVKSYYPDHYALSIHKALENALNGRIPLQLDKVMSDTDTAINLLKELQD